MTETSFFLVSLLRGGQQNWGWNYDKKEENCSRSWVILLLGGPGQTDSNQSSFGGPLLNINQNQKLPSFENPKGWPGKSSSACTLRSYSLFSREKEKNKTGIGRLGWGRPLKVLDSLIWFTHVVEGVSNIFQIHGVKQETGPGSWTRRQKSDYLSNEQVKRRGQKLGQCPGIRDLVEVRARDGREIQDLAFDKEKYI